MTAISPLNPGIQFVAWPMATMVSHSDNPVSLEPSTIVTLGGADQSDGSTYARSISAAPVKNLWQNDSHDSVSELMAHNFLSSAQSDRFSNLGAYLLQRFSTNASDFSQKVSLAGQLPGDISGIALARGTLRIKTASGAEVTLTLSNQDDSLQVDIRSKGILADKERVAVAGLAQGFQQALDGLASAPPQLDLSGLLQYDSQELSSVDFQMDLKPKFSATTQYVFHADQDVRSLSVDAPEGKVQLSVNTRNRSLWGNQAQQAQTMATYLKQFDQAAADGQADDGLLKLLKDGFSQLNRNDQPQPVGLAALRSLNAQDHAMLSGLEDFTASVNATPQRPNPKRYDEVKTFSYQASQFTEVDDKDAAERHLSQVQRTHLSASFHTPAPDKPLDFKAQNYVFNQVESSRQSSTEFAYHHANLSVALLQQSASKYLLQLEYVAGHLASTRMVPKQADRTLDLMPLLRRDAHADSLKTEEQLSAEHERRLRQVHALIQLPESVTVPSTAKQLDDIL
jgi:hypothetical protein